MQSLGLSSSTPKSENRLKSLFWPSIQNSGDVDYLGAQGYWICSAVGVLSFIVSIFMGHPIVGTLTLLFFYLGGVGVREHSRYAAAAVLTLYVTDTLVSGPGALKVMLSAVLLSNLRATWIASRWTPGPNGVDPPRFGDTWTDKFADKLPMWLWPKVRVPYYVFSAGFMLLNAVGITIILRRSK